MLKYKINFQTSKPNIIRESLRFSSHSGKLKCLSMQVLQLIPSMAQLQSHCLVSGSQIDEVPFLVPKTSQAQSILYKRDEFGKELFVTVSHTCH